VITFENVCKTYPGGVEAVRGVSLQVHDGETLVLLGTSGCGKTTTLKMVNRLIPITSGQIHIDDVEIRDRDPIELRRDIGYAIQHIGLFPHMTIAENISVVPRLRGWGQADMDERVAELLEMVGLEPDSFRERYPAQLSGGQRQRIGVARALAADPPIVLMDEPFGALDPITREQLQTEFIDLQDRLQKTVIFVTHDVFEAVKIGDRIALLDGGRLQQLAEPAEIVENPANEFVDQFLGQHRFQLALLTRTIKPLVEEGEAPSEEPPEEARVFQSHSIVEALDAFKRTGRDEVPVYDERGRFQGIVHRRHVLKAIAEAMGGDMSGLESSDAEEERT
jgi:osmoprotectant transport system ATP-binding protein